MNMLSSIKNKIHLKDNRILYKENQLDTTEFRKKWIEAECNDWGISSIGKCRSSGIYSGGAGLYCGKSDIDNIASLRYHFIYSDKKSKILHIQSLYVDDMNRKSGLATMLVYTLLEEALKANFDLVTVHAVASGQHSYNGIRPLNQDQLEEFYRNLTFKGSEIQLVASGSDAKRNY